MGRTGTTRTRSQWPRWLARVDRLLTHTVSLTGLTALVVVAYAIALAAFGRKPNGSERNLLLLSMVAASGAALTYQFSSQLQDEFAGYRTTLVQIYYSTTASLNHELEILSKLVKRSISISCLHIPLSIHRPSLCAAT